MTKLGYDAILIPMVNNVVHAIVLNPNIIELIEKIKEEPISEAFRSKMKRLSGIK